MTPESQPSRLEVLGWRWRWWVNDTRQQLLLWVVWKLPKSVCYWCVFRMIGTYGDGAVFDYPVGRVLDDHADWYDPYRRHRR